MKRAAMNVAASLMGAATGWLVMAHPLAAVFAPTTVTWDATSCPAGVYAVTSTAQSLANGNTFLATSKDISLPRAAVVHEFSDLPAGTYAVTASARATDGQTFTSGIQTVVAGSSTAGAGRRRPDAIDPIGQAQPRNTGVTSAPHASAAPGATRPPATTRGAAARRATTPAPAPIAPAAPTAVPRHEPASITIDVRIDTDANLSGADRTWRRIDFVDLDADGLIDLVTIEWVTGDVWIFSVRSGP